MASLILRTAQKRILVAFSIHWSNNLNVLSAAFMHQLILTKSGGPHPYVDPAPEKVGGQLTPWLCGPC